MDRAPEGRDLFVLPVLLRTEARGHGIGTALSTRIEEEADVYAFLVDQLGMAALPAAALAGAGDMDKPPVAVRRGRAAGRR